MLPFTYILYLSTTAFHENHSMVPLCICDCKKNTFNAWTSGSEKNPTIINTFLNQKRFRICPHSLIKNHWHPDGHFRVTLATYMASLSFSSLYLVAFALHIKLGSSVLSQPTPAVLRKRLLVFLRDVLEAVSFRQLLGATTLVRHTKVLF